MCYVLKHFNISLLSFNLGLDPINGWVVELLEVKSAHADLLPLDLEVNNQGLLKWLQQRFIPKNRAFVHSFLAKQGLNIHDTKSILEVCKALSLTDCYWVTHENFTGSFEKYNLYENRFDRSLALIAYTGYGDTVRSGFTSSPELTTDGMLAKCWRRITGEIFLYKAGTTGAANTGNEPYSEYYASQIAEKMELKCVAYNLSVWKKQLCSTCKLFTSLQVSYIPIGRLVRQGNWAAIMAYYQALGEDYYQDLMDMLIFDAVICNEDRHFGNFGVLVDNQTNRIISTAPIFDHGLSLFNYAMEEDLQQLDEYAKTRFMRGGQDFMIFAQSIITQRQKEKLRHLINFRFKKHARYNLLPRRLKLIEAFIQKRVQTLLNIPLQ